MIGSVRSSVEVTVKDYAGVFVRFSVRVSVWKVDSVESGTDDFFLQVWWEKLCGGLPLRVSQCPLTYSSSSKLKAATVSTWVRLALWSLKFERIPQ